MITIDSLVKTINHKYFPISIKKDDREDNVLDICVFNGSPYDTDIMIATLNMDTLDLDIISSEHVDIWDMFSQGFAFDVYDWSDINPKSIVDFLGSDITEEQFFLEILAFIGDSIDEKIIVLEDALEGINDAMDKITPIVNKQTKEKNCEN